MKVTMMRKLGNKMKSNSGATILFALLVFLVCAVIGSVVLSAGTAASGRFSKTAESDRRYYAVESAARLLEGVFDGKTITISRAEKETKVINYQLVTENGKTARDDGTPDEAASGKKYSAEITIDGKEPDTDPLKMVYSAALQLFGGNLKPSTFDETQYALTVSNPDVSNSSISLAGFMDSSEYSAFPEYSASYSLELLNVNTAELVFTVQSDNYRVNVNFHADIHENTVTHSDPETSVVEGTEEKVTQVTTTAKTMTITWVYDGIEVQ